MKHFTDFCTTVNRLDKTFYSTVLNCKGMRGGIIRERRWRFSLKFLKLGVQNKMTEELWKYSLKAGGGGGLIKCGGSIFHADFNSKKFDLPYFSPVKTHN